MLRLFETSLHAKLYAEFRPNPPASLINVVLQAVKKKLPLDRALDVGCGSGQNTRCLAPHFRSVLATDVSPAQIKEAAASNTVANIEYRVSAAEEIPAPPDSIQLIAACQCAHFFELPRFFAEADRVLAPGGLLALYAYGLPEPYRDGALWTELNDVILQAQAATAGFWAHTRNEVADRYSDPRFRLPYPGEVRDESHYQERTLTLDGLLGGISTWSGFQTMVDRCGAERGEALLQQTRERFHAVLSSGDPKVDTSAITITVRYFYFLLMARKPVSP
ncbi:putative methyltransferase DDB_G0268948 [Pollicipes pollicipes]|uniref:putative methyltransferase DDB_G0268948 n=1 Tax=Pollicipes pollicipes TaxID=41117 RepID=UPI0018858A08|nr:putative methyltransferase DDB_G0268948 [Pollicipes pollicipes]XP_037072388.1 putative methyltransferase DDB_G0268948 [Pollicipes pollicipes]